MNGPLSHWNTDSSLSFGKPISKRNCELRNAWTVLSGVATFGMCLDAQFSRDLLML